VDDKCGLSRDSDISDGRCRLLLGSRGQTASQRMLRVGPALRSEVRIRHGRHDDG